MSVLAVSVGLFTFNYVVNNDNGLEMLEDFEGEKIVEEGNDEKEQEIAELINETHQTLNLLTGYGSINRFSNSNEGSWVEAMTRLQQPLEEFEANLSYVTEAIYDDLKNFILVTRVALYERNEEAMLYSHRIIHDLDVAYNGYNEKIFGVTTYVAGTDWGEDRQHQRINEIVRIAKNNPLYAVDE